MAHFFSRWKKFTFRYHWCSNIVLCIDQNNTKGKLEYVSKRSDVHLNNWCNLSLPIDMNKAPHTKTLHALYRTRTSLLFETYSSFPLVLFWSMHSTIFEHQWDLKVDCVHPEKNYAIVYPFAAYPGVLKLDISYIIKVITKLPNSEQSYKGKVQTHNYINRQNQSTIGKLWKP
jgi:hypothetical protein